LILQEEETRIKLLQEHSMPDHYPHTPNSNSDIKDKPLKPKLPNEIYELNFLQLKLNIV
jgi:hypothetical protein